MSSCRYHCRKCGAHFSSLEAFDSHREGPAGSGRQCSFLGGAELVERTGVCNVADPTTPRLAVTIYSPARAEGASNYFRALEGRENAPVDVRERAV